jgi:hypothetical protein
METYTVPVEFTLRVRDAKKALEIVRDAIGLAIDVLLNEKAEDLVSVLDRAEYGEPYLAD